MEPFSSLTEFHNESAGFFTFFAMTNSKCVDPALAAFCASMAHFKKYSALSALAAFRAAC